MQSEAGEVRLDSKIACQSKNRWFFRVGLVKPSRK